MAVIIATLVYHIEAGTDYIPTQRQSVIQNAADYVRRFFCKNVNNPSMLREELVRLFKRERFQEFIITQRCIEKKLDQ